MNNTIKYFSLLVLILTLNGCATKNYSSIDQYQESTGGIVLNLFPARKNVIGEIKGDIYHSAENAFFVRLPHPPTKSRIDNNEWTYTNITELKDKGVIGVIFGPAAFDNNLYHAVMVRHAMKSDIENYPRFVFKNKLNSRKEKYEEKYYNEFGLKGKDAYYSVFESDNFYLVMALVDNQDSFHIIEADVSKHNSIISVDLPLLVDRKWELYNSMLESFEVKKI